MSPLARAAVAAAVLTALYAAVQLLAVFWLASSMSTPARPEPLGTGSRDAGPPALPLRGALHVLHRPTHGGQPFAVLSAQEPWQRSRAADALAQARTLHQVAVQRHADMSPAARLAAGGDVLGELPGTDRTLRWAQHPADLSGVPDDGMTPLVETVRDRDGDAWQFAFVRTERPLTPQVIAALQSSAARTRLQRAQLAALF